jgi:hypothetical protein
MKASGKFADKFTKDMIFSQIIFFYLSTPRKPSDECFAETVLHNCIKISFYNYQPIFFSIIYVCAIINLKNKLLLYAVD